MVVYHIITGVTPHFIEMLPSSALYSSGHLLLSFLSFSYSPHYLRAVRQKKLTFAELSQSVIVLKFAVVPAVLFKPTPTF